MRIIIWRISSFGRRSGVQQLPVRVEAPLGHRAEVRAKPRAVRLTLRDAAVQGSGGSDAGHGIAESSSASQGASLQLELGEELLDYEEEEEVHEVAVQTGAPVEKPRMSKRAVQGDRLVGCHQELVAGNLLRGEDFGYETGRAEVGYVGLGEAGLSSGRSQAVVDHGKGNVDVAIQVGVGEEPVADIPRGCGFEQPGEDSSMHCLFMADRSMSACMWPQNKPVVTLPCLLVYLPQEQSTLN
ncbi:hypothetical protein NDU88_003641 [Pleurodeles waltl]|uniref:Uncharacterized protein n=1 Tax=Pleurodeles waltl TaxID=8319 RepID=A0AAV7NJZ6_PLEWA|nr:hypothetical protein NDU88_003641 [Pleurodeles waltl]